MSNPFAHLLLSDEDYDYDEAEHEREKRKKLRTKHLNDKQKEKEERMKAEEERRFGKKPKIELATLTDRLKAKRFLVSDSERFLTFLPDVVQLFQQADDHFPKNMKEIKCVNDLKTLLTSRYQDIVMKMKEADREIIHKWLDEFAKETVQALMEMTSVVEIEKSVDLYSIFSKLKSQSATVPRRKLDADIFAKKRDAAIALEVATGVLKQISLDKQINPEVARELQVLGMNEILNPNRDTSPSRDKLTPWAWEKLNESMCDYLIPGESAVVKNEKKEEQVFADILSNKNKESTLRDVKQETVDESYETCYGNTQTRGVIIEDYKEEEPVSDTENAMEFPEYTNRNEILEMRYREPIGIAREAPDQIKMDREKNKYENRRKKKTTVKFREYDDPHNTMRIFVLSNGGFVRDGDDGPDNDYVDLTLKNGVDLLKTKEDERPFWSPSLRGVPEPTCSYHLSDKVRLTIRPELYMQRYHGNLLGRFWFPRESDKWGTIADHELRCNFGLLRQYSQHELTELYSSQLLDLHNEMRHGLYREKIHKLNKGVAPVLGVLLFTDWRLMHMNSSSLINARFQYMPTNIGDLFFETMTEYIVELCRDPTIEFHTIIFAFGGSPLFKKDAFLRFWKQLIVETTKSIDVFWMAQDWCDGLDCTAVQQKDLADFNDYVENVFKIMGETGHRNYKWWNIRKEYNIPRLQNTHNTEEREPVTLELENIYFKYYSHFVDNCNCYGSSGFFAGNRRPIVGYVEADSRYPLV